MASVRIIANSQNLTVSITKVDGSAAPAYTNGALTTAASFPATINSDTSYYFPDVFLGLSVSVTLNGTEIASSSGTPITVSLAGGQTRVIEPVIDLSEVQASLGSSVAVSEAPLSPLDPRIAAVGDGTANDLAAFTTAMSLMPAAGGELHLPRGYTFRLDTAATSGLTVPSGVSITGEGVSSVITATGDALKVKSNVKVRNLRVTGPGGSTYKAFTNDTTTGYSDSEIADCSIDNFGYGAYLDRTVDNSQTTGFRVLRNRITQCFGAAVFGVRADDLIVDGNRIAQPNSGRAIHFYGGRGHRIRGNRTTGGVTGISYLFSRSVSSAASMFERNVIEANVVDGFIEEGIAFDCHGNTAADVATVDYDTVASTSGATVTLASAAWASAGSVWNGYRMAFLTGALKGRAYRITAQTNGVFTLAAPTSVVAAIGAGDQVSILAAALNNTIVGNTVDASSSSTVGIMLWGAAFYNTIVGNVVTASSTGLVGIQVASLNGLTTASTSKTATAGRAPTGGNTISGNTVQGGDIALTYTNYGGPADYSSYGNVVTGNTVPGGKVSIDRHQDLRSGNYSGGTDTVTAAAPTDGSSNPNRDPLNRGYIATVDPLTASALSTINANRAVYMRVSEGGVISKIGLYTQVSSGNLCVGVYRNSGAGRAATPAARLATSGSVACPATGTYSEISLGASVEVYPGDWLALVPDNATASFASAGGGLLANGLWSGRAAYQDTAFPLPSTATPTVGLIKGPCLIGIP